MYFQKRGKTYSFVYYDTILKKNVRLVQEKTPHFESDADALNFCKSWEAQNESLKLRIEKRLAWRARFHNFNQLLEIFEKAKKEEAPNTWKDYVDRVQYYVLPFFLEKKHENNINLWHYHIEEFREELTHHETIRGSRNKLIAYSTINHIIASFNSFMSTMLRYHYLENSCSLRQYPSTLLNERTEESIIETNVSNMIYSGLKSFHKLSADFFLTTLHTGLRINEGMGLNLSDLHLRYSEDDFMIRALKPYDLHPIGFLTLESQPFNRNNPRNDQGEVLRKPLKGKKKISIKNMRIIPLFEKPVFNTLVERWNQQRCFLERKRYGLNIKNYLLFDGLTNQRYSKDLKNVQQIIKIHHIHSAHDTRHTYCTWLADKTAGNYTLCRMILGHHDLDMTMRYVHLNAKIKQDLMDHEQLKKPMEFIQ